MLRGGVIAVVCLGMTSRAAAEVGKIAVLPVQLESSAEGKVPDLIGEILLTAVQSATRDEVIGQDDINALLGFEKQKSLLGCDDVSCMAEIGGALGVQRIVGVKIALLESDWVVTSKLMNIVTMKVESRASDFVAGDTKALLASIPGIIRKLFAGGGASVGAAAVPLPPVVREVSPVAATSALRYDESFGNGSRATGVTLTVIGGVLAVIGTIYSIATVADLNASSVEDPGEFIAATGIGAGIYGTGLALAGIGSNVYLNGRARAWSSNDAAKGYHETWMWGWAWAGMAVAGPILSSAIEVDALGYITGLGGLATSLGVFIYVMASDEAYGRTREAGRFPLATMILLRDRDRTVPGAALSFSF